MTIGENIKKLLKEQRKTKADLARYLCTYYPTVNSWIPNDKNPNKKCKVPRRKHLIGIAEFFGVPVEVLTDDEASFENAAKKLSRYCSSQQYCDNCIFCLNKHKAHVDYECAIGYEPKDYRLSEIEDE